MTDVPTDSTNRQNKSGLTSPTDITQYNYDDHWQEIEIDLQRVNNYYKKKQNFFFMFIIYNFN